jgi:hypothetical protein
LGKKERIRRVRRGRVAAVSSTHLLTAPLKNSLGTVQVGQARLGFTRPEAKGAGGSRRRGRHARINARRSSWCAVSAASCRRPGAAKRAGDEWGNGDSRNGRCIPSESGPERAGHQGARVMKKVFYEWVVYLRFIFIFFSPSPFFLRALRRQNDTHSLHHLYATLGFRNRPKGRDHVCTRSSSTVVVAGRPPAASGGTPCSYPRRNSLNLLLSPRRAERDENAPLNCW